MRSFEDESKITRHALDRSIERCKKSRHSAERFLTLAFMRGSDGTEMPDRERLYLKSKSHEPGIQALYYAGYCLIIGDNDHIVTIYNLPLWFGKHTHRPSKKSEERIIARGGNLAKYYDSINNEWVA